MNPLFASYRLNAGGLKIVGDIKEDFDGLLQCLAKLGALEGREGAIVKTKLEEACFFAVKAAASKTENQEPA